MDDRLSPNSLFLVGKSMFLRVPVFVLDGTLRNIFGSLRTSSDVFGYYRTHTKNLGTLTIKNVTPINVKRLAGILPDTLSVCCYTFWYNIFPIINKRITNFKISLLFLTLLLATFTHDRRVEDSNKWRQTNNLS